MLATVQKIAPLFIITVQSASFNYLILLLGCFRVMIRGVLGYNQSYMRSLIGYSRIAHSGWLISVSVFGGNFLLFYFFVYSYRVLVLFLYFHFYHVLKVIRGGYTYKAWLGITLLMLTLSGVPPFSLFFMKVMALYLLSNYWVVTFLLILGSMLSIYYYLMFVIPRLAVYWFDLKSLDYSGLFFASVFVILGLPFIFLI